MTEGNILVHVGITLGQTATSLLYLVVATQIFRRHRYSLEPRHILELNTLLTCAVFAPLHIGSRYLADWPTVCGVVEWLRYYNWHDFITGLLLTQTDRFLALSTSTTAPSAEAATAASSPATETSSGTARTARKEGIRWSTRMTLSVVSRVSSQSLTNQWDRWQTQGFY